MIVDVLSIDPLIIRGAMPIHNVPCKPLSDKNVEDNYRYFNLNHVILIIFCMTFATKILESLKEKPLSQIINF